LIVREHDDFSLLMFFMLSRLENTRNVYENMGMWGFCLGGRFTGIGLEAIGRWWLARACGVGFRADVRMDLGLDDAAGGKRASRD